MSRLAMSVMGAGTDHSGEAKFASAVPGKTYFSQVHFRQETEPYMTVARGDNGGGVTVAEVNLKFVWDVSQIFVWAKRDWPSLSIRKAP